jgi:hypothetical protein
MLEECFDLCACQLRSFSGARYFLWLDKGLPRNLIIVPRIVLGLPMPSSYAQGLCWCTSG